MIDTRLYHERMLMLALAEYGVKELPGKERNHPRILEYLSTTPLPGKMQQHDETPWCASLVSWICLQAGVRSLKNAWAEAWINWGQPSEPFPGAIVVMKNHVGFFITARDGVIYCLGGNQGNEVNVRGYPASRVMGYRRARPTDINSPGPRLVEASEIQDHALIKDIA